MYDVEIKNIEPMTVAFITMQGPYAQMPDAMGRVYGWIAQHGLAPSTMPVAVFFTSPDAAPESEAIWEVQAPLTGDVPEADPDDSGVGVKRIEAQTVASTLHHGPYETMGPAYEAMSSWIEANGYAMAGPPEEVYMTDAGVVPPDEYVTEVRFPVHKQ